jgi:hypothetical protein
MLIIGQEKQKSVASFPECGSFHVAGNTVFAGEAPIAQYPSKTGPMCEALYSSLLVAVLDSAEIFVIDDWEKMHRKEQEYHGTTYFAISQGEPAFIEPEPDAVDEIAGVDPE